MPTVSSGGLTADEPDAACTLGAREALSSEVSDTSASLAAQMQQPMA